MTFKRRLALLLILGLVSGALSALAEAGGAAADVAVATPPEVGDVVYGFEALEIRDYDALGARLTWFEHQKTGAKLMYIANNDINRSFQLTFQTRAEDDTGLPHVFEHATMYGNEKYPSKSLFFNLMYQTYSTFMNAQTTTEMTMFPVSSLSEAQLLSLADYYVESCLHPLIMSDESIFKSQAWRYEMADMDSPLTYNGVVYSEMFGVLSLSSMAMINALRATFPGEPISYNFGGDPDHIPELTWDAVKAYHDRYYHPSNCVAYLYGDFDDYAAFLKLLDEAFSPYDRAEPAGDEALGYTRITEPVIESYPYPVAEGADTAGQSVVVYAIPCPDIREDADSERLVDHAVELLGAESSPLMQGLKRALPGASFEFSFEKTELEDYVFLMAQNVDPEDAGTLKAVTDEALARIAREGFDPALVDAVASRLRLDAKLARESGNPADTVDGSQLFYMLAQLYFASGDPFRYVEDQESLDDIADENARGLLARAVGDWLAEPALYTLTTTYPEAGGKEAKDAALAQKLAGIKAGMSQEELQAIVDATNAVPEEEDNSAMLAALLQVSVANLPEEYRRYEISDTTDGDGIRRVDAIADVDGVGTPMLFLDARALPQEDLYHCKFMTSLLSKLGTDAHTREEIGALADRYLMRRSIGISYCGDDTEEDLRPMLRFSWFALDEDLERGYELAEEILFHTRFDDAQALSELVSAEKALVRDNINSQGFPDMWIKRKMAATSEAYRFNIYFGSLGYYDFLNRLEAQLAEDPQPTIERLTKIQAFLANRYGALLGFAGNEASIALNRPLADALIAKLPCEAREGAVYDLPVPAASEGVIIDNNTQYNLVAASFERMGIEEDEGLGACAMLVTDRLLMPVLREQMGAYYAVSIKYLTYGLCLYTMWDPNVASTFEYLETLPELIAEMEVTQDELDGYILSDYITLIPLGGELYGARERILGLMLGNSDDALLLSMRQLKAVTPQSLKDFAEAIEKLLEAGGRSTVGSAAAINANAELYDVVLNPFGS